MSYFGGDPNFCPECGNILPVPGIQDTVRCPRCAFCIPITGTNCLSAPLLPPMLPSIQIITPCRKLYISTQTSTLHYLILKYTCKGQSLLYTDEMSQKKSVICLPDAFRRSGALTNAEFTLHDFKPHFQVANKSQTNTREVSHENMQYNAKQ